MLLTVAALLFGPSYVPPGMTVQKDLAINAFPVEQFVSGPPDYALKVGGIDGYQLKDIQPRTGNEVYFVGLFSQNYGLERNLPVARFGHISRMPSPIEFEGDGHPSFKSMAYLAEFLSWGGHSGSPVFFWEPQVFVVVEVDENDQPTGRMRQDHGHVTGFLGLISHHYTIETSGKVTGELGSVQMEQNSGIAIVIPADEIRSLLDRGDAIEQRRVLLLADNQKAIEMPEADVSGSEK